MTDPRDSRERLGGLEGADEGALGVAPPPASAPPGATVDPGKATVPGAGFDDRPPVESKPWFTSLAAGSDGAGVANDPPEAQDPQFPDPDEESD